MINKQLFIGNRNALKSIIDLITCNQLPQVFLSRTPRLKNPVQFSRQKTFEKWLGGYEIASPSLIVENMA